MRKRLPLAFLPCVIVLWLVAPVAQARSAQALEPITYSVKVADPVEHYAEVEATLPTGGRDSVELMMAVWTPGFYRVESYASRVEGLTAKTPDGKPLKVEQPKKNRWQIESGGAKAVVVTYRVLCTGKSVTGSWVGE